ncbi:MAG TPA: aliphatic sulfonate ABC transporter substrate-binding protein [Nitrosopumilaceae archaeon]|nr:aliphatic sulfonate ABC transporter substrate-binding protein [Nitrosopumilaceae archaeon]
MNPKTKFAIAGAIIAVVIAVSFTANSSPFLSQNNTTTANDVIRIGYFLNLNHAQAVIGLGNGDFQKALGDVKIKPYTFNSGPEAVGALIANGVDVTYVGPNPAINGYVKSKGEALRIIAGAASGGAVFVIRNDAGINSVDDFSGKKFASPQYGNTQDVSLRAYLLSNGYNTTENGGNVQVIPAKNAEILTLMVKKEIDGAWVPEPWGAKLVKEANGRIFVDERDLWPQGKFVTAHIIVNTAYLKNHHDIIKKLLAAHVDETMWINQNKEESLKVFNTELEKLTGKTIPEDELQEAFSRMEITYDPVKESLFKSAYDAFDIGFLDTKPDLSEIYDLQLLNSVLEEKRLATIP